MNTQNTQTAVKNIQKGTRTMGEEIKGKVIRGFRFADGVHWHWGDEEVAVINDNQEIEWCKRPLNYPEEVIEAIRKRKQYPSATWKIEVQKISVSATQGYYQVLINGEDVMHFAAEKKLDESGKYIFDVDDKDLGRVIYNMLWHSYDNLYHYSDKAKDIFYPKWREKYSEDIISINKRNDFVAQIIDAFEDFLDDKGVKLENPEKEEAVNDGEDEESIANIYGTDYGNLQDDIEVILKRWNILQ